MDKQTQTSRLNGWHILAIVGGMILVLVFSGVHDLKAALDDLATVFLRMG